MHKPLTVQAMLDIGSNLSKAKPAKTVVVDIAYAQAIQDAVLVRLMGQEPIAEVCNGYDGLQLEFIYGAKESGASLGEHLYRHPQPPQVDSSHITENPDSASLRSQFETKALSFGQPVNRITDEPNSPYYLFTTQFSWECFMHHAGNDAAHLREEQSPVAVVSVMNAARRWRNVSQEFNHPSPAMPATTKAQVDEAEALLREAIIGLSTAPVPVTFQPQGTQVVLKQLTDVIPYHVAKLGSSDSQSAVQGHCISILASLQVAKSYMGDLHGALAA